MIHCLNFLSIEQFSALIGIATPFILLIWFYYSQLQIFSKKYFAEINGIYAGFTEPIGKGEVTEGINGGIIMNIRDADSKGYFKGEFDFAETDLGNTTQPVPKIKLRDGIHTFFGKLDFKIHKNKTRHPFVPDDNRIYKGTLYIVDRLDFNFDNYKIEDYLSSEYEILHYREMGTMKFTHKKSYRTDRPKLPRSFTLYRKMDANFEPYIDVKNIVFSDNTRVDQ